jgi:thiamine biosynthesis lipoprotein
MNTTQSLLASLVVASAILPSACRRSDTHPKQDRIWETMGTFASLTFPAGVTNRIDDAERTCRACYRTINDTFSVYSPDSELSRLNAAGADAPTQLTPLAASALRKALTMAEQTGGRFDPTITPLVNLWGFNGHSVPTHPPAQEAIDTTRGTIGYQHASLDATGIFTWLKAGMSIDLGGIAKGLAVDLCYDALEAQGVTAAVINLGGNIRFLGTHPETRAWRAGVRNPFVREDVIGELHMPAGMALATSGNYERFVTIQEKRYAHIIDPTTGYPVQGMAGVTVLAPDAMTADGLSTALFVAGLEGASAILSRFPACEALMIPDTQPLTLYATPKMGDWLQLASPCDLAPIP